MNETIEPKEQDRSRGRLTIALTIAAALFGVAAIIAEILGAVELTYALKPLVILLVIGVALLSSRPPGPSYRWAIIAGLIFSLAGDVLLMLPYDLFLFGLIAFAVAQVAYTAAFVTGGGYYSNARSAVPFLLFGVFMAAFLWSGLEADGMLIPALAYLIIILVMAWQGFGHWRQTLETRSMLAFIGVLLFVASDSFLAVNRFVVDLGDLAPILVLGTYYPAQLLIGQSAGREHR
jgi:alkylglycerol monooxygenase